MNCPYTSASECQMAHERAVAGTDAFPVACENEAHNVPLCVVCGAEITHGCNSAACSSECEGLWAVVEPDTAIIDPTACACGDGFCHGCEVTA